MKSHGMPEWMVKTLLELFQVSKEGYLAEISPLVQQVLQRPARSFDQFLRQNAAPFTASPGAVGAA